MQNEDQKTSADFYKNKEARLSYQHERLANNVYVVKCFLDAIEQNKDKFKDKIVLHLSCGLGLLSLAAAKAGAAHVYAIDDANVHHFTEEIIKTTQGGYYKDKITVIHEQLKDVVLPLKMDQKVDIIICEWMGYCGILESKIYDVLFARDKWLVCFLVLLSLYSFLFSFHTSSLFDFLNFYFCYIHIYTYIYIYLYCNCISFNFRIRKEV